MEKLLKKFKISVLVIGIVSIVLIYSCISKTEEHKLTDKEFDKWELNGMLGDFTIDMTTKIKRDDVVDVNKLFSEFALELYDTDLPEINKSNDSLSSYIGANIAIEKDTITVVPFDNTINLLPVDNDIARWDVYGVCETEDCLKEKMQEIAKVSQGKCMEVRIIRDKNNSKVYGIIVACY